jgi:acyl-CoA thioester hydrolase
LDTDTVLTVVRFPPMIILRPDHHLLAGYPIAIEIPVQWGELDAYGHVNNTVLFRYFESARMAYLERCGVLESYESNRIGIILYSTECRFRAALFHPDSVLVGARTLHLEKDRFVMGYAAVSLTMDRIVAEGGATLVWFDYTKQRKVALPDSVRAAIEELEHAETAHGNGREPLAEHSP